MTGIVTKNTGSWYSVKNANGETLNCKIKGNFRLLDFKTTNPITVGDVVDYEENNDGNAWIVKIRERKNCIVRKASNLSKQSQVIAANLDLTALVVTVNYPETSTVFIDRFLATAEAYQVPACLVFNKTDLYSETENKYLAALVNLYETIGYTVFCVSAIYEESIKPLADFLKNKVTLISGNSGVGKSTIINILSPQSQARTGKISSYHNKGMHTTTFSEMLTLADGGEIIDTPGIKGFGSVEMTKYEISHYFKEIFHFSKQCRYSDCLHINEPQCAVIQAVENHYISESRYKSYVSMLSDMDEGKYRK
jgi:ribosome biogenesis GTPase